MIDTHDTVGKLTRTQGRIVAVIERAFEAPPARLWDALTDPAILCQWLAPGHIAPYVGGEAKLSFEDSGIAIDSTVTAYAWGELLEYSWSGKGEPLRPLRWEIERTLHGTNLRLTLSVPDSEDAARAAAGFEAHLDMLAAALEGVPIKFPFARFKSMRDTYRAQLASA